LIKALLFSRFSRQNLINTELIHHPLTLLAPSLLKEQMPAIVGAPSR
jgi:hypothetical protein